MEVDETFVNTLPVEKQTFRTTLKQRVSTEGFASGIRSAIEFYGGKLKRIIHSEGTQNVLESEPTILLVTHNYSYEVFAAIGGIPDPNKASQFRDVRLVSEASSEPDWLDRFTIPLYNVDGGPKSIPQRISRTIHPKKEIPKEEATFENFRSLMKASEYVADGGLVVMCPEGTRNKEGHWQKGVAALVKAAQRYLAKKDRNGYLVMCDIKGIGFLNYVADKASGILPTPSPYKNVTVRYSQPIPLTDIQTEGQSGEDISSQLESLYNHWKKEEKIRN